MKANTSRKILPQHISTSASLTERSSLFRIRPIMIEDFRKMFNYTLVEIGVRAPDPVVIFSRTHLLGNPNYPGGYLKTIAGALTYAFGALDIRAREYDEYLPQAVTSDVMLQEGIRLTASGLNHKQFKARLEFIRENLQSGGADGLLRHYLEDRVTGVSLDDARPVLDETAINIHNHHF